MKNEKNLITRTAEDVERELQEAEQQRRLWNNKVKGLRKEAKAFETEEVVEDIPETEVTETTEEVVEETTVEEVTETTEEEVEEVPEEEVSEEEVPEEEVPEEEVSEEEIPEEEEPEEEEPEEEEPEEEEPEEEIPEEEEPEEEIPEEEEPEEEEPEYEIPEKEKPEKKFNFSNFIKGVVAVGVVAIVILLAAIAAKIGNQPVVDPDNNNGGAIVTPGDDNNTPQPGGDNVADAFDMDAFTNSVVNIANTLTTDEDIATNTDIFVEKIGADKLEELVGKYGELTVQKAIAEYLAFVPSIKMDQYINNNGLVYNPNAANEYYQMLEEADKAYMDATGKNPSGALMSLEGYDTHKSNREAMKALITESGDFDLLTWYEAKTNGYDAMVQQNNDTKIALDYKEEVKLELVNNMNGSIKLLELQLEQKVNGTDANTLKYTNVYAEFIINNYMYVVAN